MRIIRMRFSTEELNAVKKLYDGKRGARSIAKELGITRHRVICIYEELEIDNSNIKKTKKEISSIKVCKSCELELSIDLFRKRIRNNPNKDNEKYIHYEPYCLDCESKKAKIQGRKRYQSKGKQEFKEMYSDDNTRKEFLDRNKKYRQLNKDKLKNYRESRVEKDRENLRNWQNKKRKEDPAFKLRSIISTSVAIAIKKKNCSKNGSILKHLPYTILELKDHLESQFEPWMSWDNHGKYNAKTWNDNDSSTWTWQLDHIIPHSEFPYTSMTDENFKKCWALTNLRPLSAKQNLLDGTNRVRHKS